MMNSSKQIILALIFAVFGLIACKNSTQKNSLDKETSKVDSSSGINSDKENNDSNGYGHFIFPTDSLLSTKVLTTGTFHSNEVWENVDKVKWLGLFQGKEGYYLAETKLKSIRVNDPTVDENDKTGWEVKTINKDTCIILIEPIQLLTPHKVQQAVLSAEQILPSDTMAIDFMGIKYQLFATGQKKKVQDNPEWYEVWNYKLYLTAKINGQNLTSLLVSQPSFDDEMINIVFAGDIDGDKILDLIIDTSRHYNGTSPTLYLSKPAKTGEIVIPIGRHSSVGC